MDSVTFSRAHVPLIEDVTLSIESGICAAVMGASGSGRTLLLKLLAGLVPPTSGEVSFDGRPLSAMSDPMLTAYRLEMGFVFQDAALWQNLSVYQNLVLALQYHRPEIGAGEVDARVRSLCRRLEFKEDLSLRPALLSVGERKTASIIRALMMEPRTVLLDEPGGGLDSRGVDRLLGILKELKQSGATIVVATHDVRIVSMLADRVVVMDQGHMIANDDPSRLASTSDARVREILMDLLQMSATYDTEILDILGADDGEFGVFGGQTPASRPARSDDAAPRGENQS